MVTSLPQTSPAWLPVAAVGTSVADGLVGADRSGVRR